MARASSGGSDLLIGFKKTISTRPTNDAVAVSWHRHHEMILELYVVQTVEHLTSSLEEPLEIVDVDRLTMWRRCVQACDCGASGDGGDEVFAGHDRYRIHSSQGILEQVPAWLPILPREAFARAVRDEGQVVKVYISLPWQERYVDRLSFLPDFERDMPLLPTTLECFEAE